MKTILSVSGFLVLLLAGCMNPTKPEISTINPSLPFNKAMASVIEADEFLRHNLRPGFYRAEDGTPESYVLTPDEEARATVDHLVLLTRSWCTQNGGQVKSFPEMPVLQRGIGNVVQRRENLPVVGEASNLICYRGQEALAAAAIGRDTSFLNALQFRQAMRDAGASVNLRP